MNYSLHQIRAQRENERETVGEIEIEVGEERDRQDRLTRTVGVHVILPVTMAAIM